MYNFVAIFLFIYIVIYSINMVLVLGSYGTTAQGGLTYKFEVPNGKYNVSMGFFDPWAHKDRIEDILINGNVVEKELCPTVKGKVPNKYVAEVKDGILTVRVQKSINGKDKPLISWIIVSK